MQEYREESSNKEVMNDFIDSRSSSTLSTPNTCCLITSNETPHETHFAELSFLKMMGKSFTESFKLALSYSFSFMVFSIGFIIAGYGKKYLLASPLISTFIQTTTLITLSPTLVASFMTGVHFGKRSKAQAENNGVDEEEAIKHIRDIFRGGLLYCLFSLPLGMGILYNSEFLLNNILGQTPEVSAAAAEILQPYTAAFPGIALRLLTEQILLGRGDVNLATFTSLPCFLLATANAVFDPLKFGIKNVVWSYVVESWTTALAYSAYLIFHKNYQGLHLFRLSKKGISALKGLKDFFLNGWPMILSFGVELGSITAIPILAGLMGDDSLLGALSFTFQLYFVAVTFMIAFGQYSAQEQSRAIGEGAELYASRFTLAGLASSTLFMLPLGILPAVKADWFARLLSVDLSSNTFKIAQIGLMAKAGEVVFDNARYHFIQASRPANDWVTPTIIYSFLLVLSVVGAYFFELHTDLGGFSLFVLPLIGIGLSAAALLPIFIKNTQRLNIQSCSRIEEITDSDNSNSNQNGFFGEFWGNHDVSRETPPDSHTRLLSSVTLT